MSLRIIAATAIAFSGAAASVVAHWLAFDGEDTAFPQERPSHFVSHTVATIAHDDYANAWASLYPPHQAVAPRDEYVACEMKTPLGWKLRRWIPTQSQYDRYRTDSCGT